MADDSRKLELIADLARARGELTAHTRAVRRELDVPARLKSSFRRHGRHWLARACWAAATTTPEEPCRTRGKICRGKAVSRPAAHH